MLTSELVGWRQDHERNFRVNPAEPIDRRDVDELDRELEAKRHGLLGELRHGPDALNRLRKEIESARRRMMPMLDRLWTELKVAQAQRSAL